MRRPIVIAHRGACGYLPEHTLAAYALAIEQGADFIEPDLVPTADGVLIARHDNELSATTDVAAHREFAARRCRKRIDGEDVEGWFSEDFRWAEIRQLRARERLPELRPQSARHDGVHPVPCFAEIVALVRAAEAGGRRVGLYPEIKHPTWFAQEGRRLDGGAIALSPAALLVAQLQALDFVDPARLFLQSFEPTSLRELRTLLDAAGLRVPAVQLLGRLDGGDGPWDLRGAAPAPTWRDLIGGDGLAALRGVADALGPHVDDVLAAPDAFAAARAQGFALHPYTLRVEFDGVAKTKALLALGIDGFFTDQADVGVALRDGFRADAAG